MLDRFLVHHHGVMETRAYDTASAVVAGVTPNELMLCRRVLHIPLKPSPVPFGLLEGNDNNYKAKQYLPIMITVRVDNRLAIVFLLFKIISSSSGVIIAANTCTAMAKP